MEQLTGKLVILRNKMALWKMATTTDKRALVLFNTQMGMIITITKTDIFPITCRAWDNSFARAACGKIEILKRGWGTLNQALLLVPENLNTKIVVSVEEDDGEQQEVQHNNKKNTKNNLDARQRICLI